MIKANMFRQLRTILLCILVGFGTWHCATQGQLTGGAKDETPPSPKSYSVPDSTVNFSAKTLEIVFDENIQLKNPASEIYISPPTSPKPQYNGSGKKLKIKFDSLKEGRTYVINFRNGLADLNEGNPLKDFTYTFSTGSEIDTLQLVGGVTDAEKGEAKKSVLVGGYLAAKNEMPEHIQNKVPDFVTYANENGQFALKALPTGNLFIVAFDDKNRDLKWQPIEEGAFLSESISTQLGDTLLLRASTQRNDRVAVDYEMGKQGEVLFTLSQPIAMYQLQILEGKGFHSLGSMRDTLTVFPESGLNELNCVLSINGSQKDTFSIDLKSLDEEEQDDNTLQLKGSKIARGGVFIIRTKTPIVTFDEKKIRLLRDSTEIPDAEFFIEGKLNEKFIVKYDFQQDLNYSVVLDSGSVIDQYGSANDAIDFKWVQRSLEDLSFLISDSLQVGAKHLLVDVLNEKGNPIRSINYTVGDTLKVKDVSAGKYTLKIVHDLNQNGIWDPMKLVDWKQPERVVRTPIIQVLEGWDNELIRFDLNLLN